MSTGDLPKYAAKGERQKLDLDWIKLLHQEGLPPFLPVASDPPAKFWASDTRVQSSTILAMSRNPGRTLAARRVSAALVLPWTDQGGGWPPAPRAT